MTSNCADICRGSCSCRGSCACKNCSCTSCKKSKSLHCYSVQNDFIGLFYNEASLSCCWLQYRKLVLFSLQQVAIIC
uniref:Metallothionein n=1 Tax=Mola mola TaxID=94237 RepID=A0A3Q3VPM7_MOLML